MAINCKHKRLLIRIRTEKTKHNNMTTLHPLHIKQSSTVTIPEIALLKTHTHRQTQCIHLVLLGFFPHDRKGETGMRKIIDQR